MKKIAWLVSVVLFTTFLSRTKSNGINSIQPNRKNAPTSSTPDQSGLLNTILSSLASPVFADGGAGNYSPCWNMSFTSGFTDFPPYPAPTDDPDFVPESYPLCSLATYPEPDYSLTWEPYNALDKTLCLKENSSSTITAYLKTSPSDATINDEYINHYIFKATASQNSGPIANIISSPLSIDFSGTNITESANYTFTAPPVSVAQSGTVVDVDITGEFYHPAKTDPDFDQNDYDEYKDLTTIRAKVQVEHVNTSPTISELTPADLNTVVAVEATTNVPVTAKIDDLESNTTNATIELSNDNFATILQSQNFTGVTAGTTLNHTFTNLPVGSYRWRVAAAETNGAGNCTGYANADPPINLSANSPELQFTITAVSLSSTPTPTSGLSATPTPTPSFSPPSASQSNSSSSGSNTGSGASSSSDPAPNGTPDLFQGEANSSTSVTLYFSPVTSSISEYVVGYGTTEGVEQYGVTIPNPQTSGVVSYTINDLLPNTDYYFHVRAGNGRTPGAWSKWLKVRTDGKGRAFLQTGDNAWIMLTTALFGMILSLFGLYNNTIGSRRNRSASINC